MQPVASDDVAAVLAVVAVETPLNGTVELAGPEPIRMDELVRRFLNANGDARQVTTDVHALYFGIEGERSKPHPRKPPAHRPDALRGLAVFSVDGGSLRFTNPVLRVARRSCV